jgi:hypothetical protein
MIRAIRSARPLRFVVALSLGMVYAPTMRALPAADALLDVRVLGRSQGLAGADVRVVNIATAEVTRATTDATGNVTVPVEAGTYQITVKAAGFLATPSNLVTARPTMPASATVSMAAAPQEYSGGGQVISVSGNQLTLADGTTLTIPAAATFNSNGLYFSTAEIGSALNTTDAQICVAVSGDPVVSVVAGACGPDSAVLGAAGATVAVLAGGAGGGISTLAIVAIIAGAGAATVAIVNATNDDTP